MARKIIPAIILFLTLISVVRGQTKMITGQKHVIFVDVPKNWLQAQNNQLPFFIKPSDGDINEKTYMYVYGLDYQSSPDINGWIKGDNDDMSNKHPGLKIDSLPIKLNNITKKGYLTGRYKIVTYNYTDGHQEAMLVIECQNSIVTAVLSCKNKIEFDKYLPDFNQLIETIKVLTGTVKIEKQ